MFARNGNRKCLVRSSLQPARSGRAGGRLAIEALESRRLLAYSVELTPTGEVVFLGDQADDNLILRMLPDGLLEYTTIELGGPNSSTDLNTSVPGQQSIQVSQITSLTVDAGTGTDSFSIASDFRLTMGSLSVTADRILIDTATVETAAMQTFIGTLILTEDTSFKTQGADFDASDGWITSDEAGPYQLDIVTRAIDAPSGSVILSQVGDADGVGLENTGVGQLTISTDGNAAGDLIFDRTSAGDVFIGLSDADFRFDGGDVRLHDSTRIDTQRDTAGDHAGSVFLGGGDVYSADGDLTLWLDTSATGTGRGGDVTLGPVKNHGGGFFLRSLQIESRGGPTGADGRIHLGDDILVDGGLVRLSGPVTIEVQSDTTVRIDTEQDSAGPAGDIDLRQATVTAVNENVDLSLVASTGDENSAGGVVTLGSFSPIATQTSIRNLQVDTAGGTDGQVVVPGALRLGGNILFENSTTVDINGDIEAENDLSVENAQNVDLAENVDLTTIVGDLHVAANVAGIDLSGAVGAHVFSAGGSVNLASITDRGSPQSVVVMAGDDVSLVAVTLDGAADPVLDIRVNQALREGAFQAGALEAGTIILTSNHDVTISDSVTATVGSVTATVSELGTSGNLILTDSASITSLSSNVELLAGDDIRLHSGTAVVAAGTLTINGDFDPDNRVNDPQGTTIELLGAVAAMAVDIAGDANNDTFTLDVEIPAQDVNDPAFIVTGAAGDDTFYVRSTAGPTTIEGSEGDDLINVSSDAPTMSTGTVDGIVHALTVNGGQGDDTLHVSDQGDRTGDNGTLSPTEINGLGNDGTITYDVDGLILDLGAGDDTLRVTGTHGGSTTLRGNDGDDTLNIQATGGLTAILTGDGADTINVSTDAPFMSTGTVDQIVGALAIDGNDGVDTLNVSDLGDVTGDNGTLSPTELNGLGNAGTITYAVDALNLDLGAGDDTLRVTETHGGSTTLRGNDGDDTLNIQATGGLTAILAGGGADTINVSSNAPIMSTGTVDGIAHALTVDGGEGEDALHVSDQGDTTSDNGTLSPTEINGLGNDGTITYDVDGLVLDLGAGDDTLLVTGTHGGSTTLRGNDGDDTLNIQATGGLTAILTGDGADTINVSSDAPTMSTGTVDGIAHALTVNGGEGEDALHVSDQGDRTGDNGTLSPTEISGLGNDGTITYDVDGLLVGLGAADDTVLVTGTHRGATTIDGNGGDDTLHVQATTGPTIVHGGEGNDVVHVSSDAPTMTSGTVDGITGTLTVNGDEGIDTLNVSDMGDPTGDSGTLGRAEITGLGNDGTIAYAVDTLNLDLGRGDDLLLVTGTHQGETTVHANAGGDTLNLRATGGPTQAHGDMGDDVFNVSSDAPILSTGTADQIVGALAIDGNEGLDTLNVSDKGDTTGDNGTLSPTEIRGLGNAGTITYAVDALNLDLGTGDDTLRVTETHGGSTTLRGNAGDDTLNVNATGGPTAVHGNTGNDTFNVGQGDLDTIRGPMTITGDDHNPTPTRAVASGGQVHTLGLPVGPDGYTTGSKFVPGQPVDQAIGDRLNLFDGQATVSSTYLVAPRINGETPQVFEVTVVSSPDGPETPQRQFSMVDYSTIETVQLAAGIQNDVIEIESADAEPPADLLQIDGGGGDDNYAIFRGTSSGDVITVDDTNPEATDRAPIEIDNIDRIRVRGGAGDDVIHNRSAAPGLLEGDQGDDILVTDEALRDVLTGGGGRDALFGTGTGTFYLPDAEVDEAGDLSESRVDGDLVVANGPGGQISSLGRDLISGRGCGDGDLFVDGGEIGVLCWLKAIFLSSSRPIFEGPGGAQARIDQLTAPPPPNNSSVDQGQELLTAPPPAATETGDPLDVAIVPTGVPAAEPAAGDANRDGFFNQLDIMQVLMAATYRTAKTAQWNSGDWNGDGRFDQRDLLVALQNSRYGARSHPAESEDDDTEIADATDTVLAMADDWLP